MIVERFSVVFKLGVHWHEASRGSSGWFVGRCVVAKPAIDRHEAGWGRVAQPRKFHCPRVGPYDIASVQALAATLQN